VGLALPPLVLFGWLLAGPETLGQDYAVLPLRGGPSLRYYTRIGIEPLYYPHQTGGVPVGGLFFGQYFHLPAWLASELPGYWSGEVLRLTSLRHLLLLAAAHALYYAALRRGGGLPRVPSYALAFLAVYHLRTLDGLRYALAFEAAVYAQAVLLLSALHVLRPSRGLLALVVVASQLLLTCGYPVVLPHAALGALLLGPALLAAGVGWGPLLRRGLATLAAAGTGALLAAPSWLAFSEWLVVNDRRTARADLEWAGAWAMEPRGVLENFVYPWTAEVHSAFGGPTLMTVAALALALALLRSSRRAWLLAFALPLLLALGPATPVFPFFFEHVPGFGFLRVPGRVLVLLPVLAFGGLLCLGAGGERRLREALPSAAAAALGLCLAGLVLVGLRPDSPLGGAAVHEYSGASLSAFWTPGVRAAWLGLGALAAGALLAPGRRELRIGLAALATVAQAWALMRHGTWTEERPSSGRLEAYAAADQLPLYGAAPFQASNDLNEHADATATVAYTRFRQAAGRRANCFLPVDPRRRRFGVLVPFHLSPNVVCVRSTAEALERLARTPHCRDTEKLWTYVTDSSCAGRPPGPPAPGPALAALNESNRLVALTPNLAALEVAAPRASVLVTPYPNATANWSATIDGAPAALLEVDGGFLGLRVPAGRHRVEVRYFSRRILAGYRIAFAAALVLGAAAAWRLGASPSSRHRPRAAALALLVAAVGAAAYPAWERAFLERAGKRVLLPSSYPDRLSEQLARWRGPSPR